jgi:hypothetical protein
MFSLQQPDRWSCITCGKTEVPNVPEAAMHAAIVRVQQLHARQHATERHLPTAGAR